MGNPLRGGFKYASKVNVILRTSYYSEYKFHAVRLRRQCLRIVRQGYRYELILPSLTPE